MTDSGIEPTPDGQENHVTPPPQLPSRWAAVVEAERRFSQAVREIPRSELQETLIAALGDFSSRHVALAILASAQPQLTVAVLPALEPLLLVAPTSLDECRSLVLRLSEPERSDFLRRMTAGVTGATASDDEAYRRLAELLRSAEAEDLLSELARAAARSDDPDIREVGDDFGDWWSRSRGTGRTPDLTSENGVPVGGMGPGVTRSMGSVWT